MISKKPSFQTSPDKSLQRTFEHAVRDIYEVSLTGKTSSYRTPISQRSAISGSPVNAEKRAVSDAARALAQLWKVSTNPGRY